MEQAELLVSSSRVEDLSGARPVQTVVLLLGALGASPRPMSLSEIMRFCSVPKATAHRYLSALVHYGYVFRSADSNTYSLGSGVLDLSRAYYLQFRGLINVREALPALAKETGETAHVGVLNSDKVIYIDIAESKQRIRAYISQGEQLPAYCVAAGQAILAHTSENIRENIIAAGMPVRTENTITDRSVMEARLQDVRRQGYAITHCEWTEDVIGISAPVFDASMGPIAAIGISCPLSRSTAEHVNVTCRTVKTYAQRLSRAHGYMKGEINE